MTTAEFIKYLRLNLQIQSGSITDNAYLNMSDEDIELFIRTAVSRDFPKYSLDNLPNECVYPVLLVTKRDLFYSLATQDAPLYDMTADQNNSLSRSQRFEHYMSLIRQVDSEIAEYDNGSGVNNTLSSFNVVLDTRDGTYRNRELGVQPCLTANVDSITKDSVCISWSISNVSRLQSTKVYFSTAPIYDEYTNKISDSAKLLNTFVSLNSTKIRVTGLNEGTEYHFLVCVTSMNGKQAFYELSATPISEIDVPVVDVS